MRVDIIGGGILGLSLGHELLKQGAQVRIWERGADLGGLMGRLRIDELGGVEVDRYYHAILNSDRTLMRLFEDLGLRDELRMQTTKMGFYHDGRCYPMSTPLEFLRFPPLRMLDRLRLAYTILACRRIRDWHKLEQLPVTEWLAGLGGQRTVDHIWKPLLRAKFDGRLDTIPATYIWSRLVRMTDTRDASSQKEQMCYLPSGYRTLIDALADRIRRDGGEIMLNSTVDKVTVEGERITGLWVNGQHLPAETVIMTPPTPVAQGMLPPEAAHVSARWSQLNQYLGISCLLVVLKRSLIPYYTLNITDERIPFTGVIETTNLIDPSYVGGYHLVYLPKYVAPDSPYARMDAETLTATFLTHLREMFPDLRDDDILATRLGRERYVEPLHPVGQTAAIPPHATDVAGLYLANTTQIYPALTNGESVVAFAQQVARQVVAERSAAAPALVPALA